MNGADRENLHSAMGASNSHLESIDDTLRTISKQMEEILQLLIERPKVQLLMWGSDDMLK